MPLGCWFVGIMGVEGGFLLNGFAIFILSFTFVAVLVMSGVCAFGLRDGAMDPTGRGRMACAPLLGGLVLGCPMIWATLIIPFITHPFRRG